MDKNKVNWKQKLSSRKFWAAVAGFATAVLGALNVPDSVVAQVGLIISAVGVLTAYIVTEGNVDAKRGVTVEEGILLDGFEDLKNSEDA